MVPSIRDTLLVEVKIYKSSKLLDVLNEFPVPLSLFFLQKLHGYKIPEWAEPIFPTLDLLTGLHMKFLTLTHEAKRIRAGPLLHKILTSIQKFINSAPNSKKFLMYSAHDSTLGRLMGALEIFDPIVPPYASALMIELHRDPDSDYYVKVNFNVIHPTNFFISFQNFFYLPDFFPQ